MNVQNFRIYRFNDLVAVELSDHGRVLSTSYRAPKDAHALARALQQQAVSVDSSPVTFTAPKNPARLREVM